MLNLQAQKRGCVHVDSSMNTEDYCTPGQVAKRLRVDRTTVHRWIRTGALEAETVKQGSQNRFYIPKAWVDRIEQ
jgi:excisionase family DNA binding protein